MRRWCSLYRADAVGSPLVARLLELRLSKLPGFSRVV